VGQSASDAFLILANEQKKHLEELLALVDVVVWRQLSSSPFDFGSVGILDLILN